MLRRSTGHWFADWVQKLSRSSRRSQRHSHRTNQPPVEALESRLLLAAPIANPDQYSLAHDRSFTPVFGVLQNDTDADFEPLAAQLVSGPAHGTLTLQSNGLFTYTPQSGFLGTDQFTYVAADATSTSLPATVTLTVTNTPPVAQADTFTITRDLFDSVAQGAPRLTANDTDRDGDNLTAQLVSPPSRGQLVINTDGTWRYTPEPNWFGTDTATYRSSDGLATSDPATITFQVTSPFSAAGNLPDVPLTGLESQGELATSLLTGEAVVTATAGRQTLVYSSLAADPRPVIAVDTTFANPPGPNANSVPDRIEAQLTFNGVAGPKVVYATSTLRNNDPLRFALQADARGLATGVYAYRVRLVAFYGTQTTTRDFTGTTAVVNRQASEFGPGWSLAGFDRLVNIPATITSSGSVPAGQLLVLGTGGALFFEKTGATTFASPAGPLAFHTLAQDAGGNFTLIAPTGERQVFNSTGQLTQLVDSNGNATALTYTAGLLTKITDPFTRTTTFTYATNKLASVTDFAGKVTTLTREAGTSRLLSVATPDPDGTGSLVSLVTTYTYDSNHKLATITLPGNQVTQLTYAFSGRLRQITRPDASTRQFAPRQTAGLVDLSTGVGTSSSPAALYRDGPPATLVTNEFSQETRVRVDRFGNELSRQSALGFVTQTVRDANGRPLEVRAPDPDGDSGPLAASVTRFQYDRSNLVQLTAADGGVWSFTYDFALNRPLSQTDPRGQTTSFTYDTRGNRITETDALGFTTQYTYSARGQLWTITQPDPVTGAVGQGPTTSFIYDTRNRLQTITYPTSTTRKLTYDTSDNLLTDTDELSRKTTNAYDQLNRLTTTTRPDPDGTGPLTAPVTQLVYNAIGLVSQSIDPLGQATQYTYDPQRNWLRQVTAPDPDGTTGSDVAPVVNFTYDAGGRRLTQTDPLGAVTKWEYDADSRVTKVTLPDPDGPGGVDAPQQSFDYDRMGRVIAVADPLGRTTRTSYDAVGRVVAETSPLGFVTQNSYDLAGNLVAQTLPDPDGAGPLSAPVTTNSYDALNRVIAQTDPRGNVTQATYDPLGRMVAVTQPDPDGSGPLAAPVWQWGYNTRGWVTSATDPLGYVTQYTRDNAGQVKVITDPDPDGAGPLTSPTTTYTYDLLGRVKSVKDMAGTTAYAYDKADRVTSITDPRGAVTQTSYDFLGRTVAITEPDPTVLTGGTARPVTTFRYDAAGQLLSRTDPVGATTSWTRDRLGRVISQTDPLGRTSTSTYDAASQVVAVDDPLGNRTQFVYDADGRQTQVTLPDPDGAGPLLSPTRQTTFDNLGRTIRTLDERQGETLFTYDLNSNLASLRDPGGNTTSWVYDGLDRQIRETNALGASRLWEYNARGELTSQIDRNGRQTKWVYDGLGRATTETWLTGTTVNNTLTYTWDSASRLKTAGDAVSKYAYTYLATGQVATVTNAGTAGAPTVALTHTYDFLGRRTELKASIGGAADFKTNFQYNARGELTQVTQQQQGTTRLVTPKRVDFSYNLAGERDRITRTADLAGTQVVATTTAQYDPAGRLTEWKHVQNSAGAEINRYTWTYDALGRPVTQGSADGSTTYQYDAASQVTAATHTSQTSESYQYDPNGNRTNPGTTTGDNNRLLSDDRYDYQYDAEGNRTRRTDRATGKYEVLAWDHRNRLTSVTTFNATGTKLAAAEFTYDVFDRRIARKVDADGNGVFETTQRFVYDGEDLILAFSGTTNILTNRYLYGPATDEILADEKITTGSAGTVNWSLGDNLGTIRDLVQYNAATGTTTVVNHVRYDTFGQIVGQTNTAFQPFFAYTGREWDPAVGLYFYRARWYDPRAGRFTSEDPLGFVAGDVNLSRYVGNGPTLWVDPSGMDGSAPGVTPDQMNDYLHAPLNWALSNGWRPSQDTNFGDFSFMRVTADRTLWEWWTNAPPDVLGIVLYNPKEEYGKQLAEETARLMKAGRGINDIRTHIQTGATAANILVQMANDPLDVIVSFQDAYHKKTPRSFLCAALSIVPFVPGSIIRKGDDLGVLGKAEVMATNEATAAVTRSIGAKTWQEYESGIRRLYGASSVGSRKFKTVVDGKVVNGVADNITTIGGRSVAVEAKFVNDWAKSIRNPASPIGNMPFAVAEQANMLEQARKYSAAFDEVICHSNSPELIAHYSTVFQGAGILNFRFILTQ